MHRYAAFGLCIHSDIELSGFAPGGEVADITIQHHSLQSRKVEGKPVQGDVVSGRIEVEPWELDLKFYLREGRDVYYQSERPIAPGMLRSFVQGALLAGVLRQRGLLVLHGSAVSDGERAVAFLGNSGWGKSTLAEYFCQRGYELITDDIMVVHPGSETERAVVPPGVKQVRLRPSAAERLVEDYEALPLVTEISKKRERVLKGEDKRAIPLEKLYILKRDSAEENKVVPVSSQEAILHFIAHTHSTNWITDPSFVADHLSQCAQLSQHTSVSQLHRVLDLDELPAIFDVVQRDLAALRSAVVGDAAPHSTP